MAPADLLREELVRGLRVVSLPLETRFRGLATREVAIIETSLGVGEWSAFEEYGDEEASWWLATAIEQIHNSVSQHFEGTVATNAIIPAMPLSEIERWWQRFEGSSVAKIKVAEANESLKLDIARVAEVRRVVGPKVRIRLDANGAWTPEEARTAISALEEFDIDYVEQPVATLREAKILKKLLGSSPTRLAADETVRKSHRLDLLNDSGFNVAIIKPSALGGFKHSLNLAKEALSRELEVVVSSGLESSVGLAHAANVAVAVDALSSAKTAHGLSTGLLLSDDVVGNPLKPKAGSLAFSSPSLDYSALERLAVNKERKEWWALRLLRCLPLAMSKLETVSIGN